MSEPIDSEPSNPGRCTPPPATGSESGTPRPTGADRIRDSLAYVRVVARRFLGRGLAFDELIAAGNLGLVEAGLRFDPMRNVRFVTYADWWVRKSIHEALGHQSGPVCLPRYQHDRLRLVLETRRILSAQLGGEPSSDQLADDSGLARRQVEQLLGLASGSISLEQPAANGDGRPLSEVLTDSDPEGPQRQLILRDLARCLRRHLDELAPRERQVIGLRFGFDNQAPLTLREAGRMLGISRERVRQLELRALLKLKQLF